jgi:hypothetical protein
MKRAWYTAYTSVDMVVLLGGNICRVRASSFIVGRSHALCFQASDDNVKSPSESQIHVVTVMSEILSLMEESKTWGDVVVIMIAIYVF